MNIARAQYRFRLLRMALPILLAALLLPLCSCSRKADVRTEDGRVIVNYWEKWTGFEDDAMQAVVDDFNRSQNRIFVKKLAISEMLRKLMLATVGGNPPDVAGLWSSYIPDFAERGALTPLNKMIDQAGIKADDYIPTYWQQCAYQDFMWALPSTPTTLALHWNKKMFRQAGLDPNRPPRSLDELDAMSDKLTIVEINRDGKLIHVRYPDLTEEEKRAKNFKLVQVGHLPTQPGWWIPEWVWWFGGRLWDGQRTITANSPEGLQTFDWLRRSSEKFGIENLRSFGATFGNFASPSDPFLAGQVAMELQGVWMYNFISKYAPQLEWGAAPFPAKDPARFPQVTLAECDVLLIPKGAAHPKEAFEFIRYVNSQGPMEKLCLGQRKFSPLVKVSDEFMRHHPNPYIKTFIELARSPQAQYVPRLTVWAEYLDELNVAADRVISLDARPQQALDQVQNRIQRKLDRVARRWDAVKAERLEEWSNYVSR